MNSSDEVKQDWPVVHLTRAEIGATVMTHMDNLTETYVPLYSVRERLMNPDFIDSVLRASDRNEEWETDVSDHTPEGEELWDRVARVLAAAFPEEVEGA